MKKLITLILLVTTFIGNSQIADYFIEYSFVSIKDTISCHYAKPELYFLYKVKDQSRFISEANYYNDSLDGIYLAKNPSPTLSKNLSQGELERWVDRYQEHSSSTHITSRSRYFVQKNSSDNECIIFAMKTYPQHYLKEDVNVSWTIHKERQVIQGIDCIKASGSYGGRNYHAWFAPSIPINDGPYVFRGLPGLIVKIEDENKWYSFEVQSTSLKKSQRFWKKDLMHKSYVSISRKEYTKLMFKELTNPDPPIGLIGDTENLRLITKEKNKTRIDLILERY